jgi:hypothetical protein
MQDDLNSGNRTLETVRAALRGETTKGAEPDHRVTARTDRRSTAV